MFYNIKCNKSACLTVFSANGSPINVRFSQRFQLSPQDLVLRPPALGICIHHRLRYFTNILQQLSVTGYIGGSLQGINVGYSYEMFTGGAGMGNGYHELVVSYQMDINLQKKGRNLHKSARIL